MYKDIIEKFIESYYNKDTSLVSNIIKKYTPASLEYIVIFPNNRNGKKIIIWDENISKIEYEDNDELIELRMNILYENIIAGKSSDMVDMINFFLREGRMKDYFYYDFGDGKCVEEIPKVNNAYEWEEQQLIPILKDFDIFEVGNNSSIPKCSYFDKGSKELQFIRDVINEYGSIKFGDILEIGITKMTKDDYEELEDIW